MRLSRITREVIVAGAWGFGFALLTAILIVLGSRNLSHFDAALVGYTFATLFAVFGIVYRYAMWLQRPPTNLYWRRGWQVFFKRGQYFHNFGNWFRRVFGDIAGNRFIFKRGKLRWLTHLFLMWGCTLAAAITFPLVFGWLHFESKIGNPDWYQMFVFGFPVGAFPIHSLFAFFVFHGLVWAAFLVIVGVMLAMRRRMREEGAAALQHFGEDFLPLILLFAVSLTGLLLTVSYTWLLGYGYDFLSMLHAITVIFTLIWLPFGKFFHIFQRPAQLGVSFYKDAGLNGEAALCRRCGHPFSSKMHILDLIEVEKKLGYNYETPNTEIGHYQWICPPCRRSLLALSQGRMRFFQEIPIAETDRSSSYANPELGEGPLGLEDKKNFHP